MPVKTKPKRNKYNAQKIVVDGVEFASTNEAKRYMTLKKAQDAGLITDLELQPKYEILPAIKAVRVKHLKTKDKTEEYTAQRSVVYTADFRYRKDGEVVVEESKGSKFAVSRDFPLRAKMLRYFHGIQVKLVFNPNDPV